MARREVSVILPTHNRAAWLREAIESVLAQTHPHWELIVIDDGSTDETPEYLRKLAGRQLRVIQLQHCGNPAKLRNIGLGYARGEYVAFLDSDDWWEPCKLSLQLDHLLNRPECGWSYTRCRWVDEEGSEIPLPEGRTWVPYDGWVLAPVLTFEAIVCTPTVMVRRSLLAEVGGFDEWFLHGEDWDLWARLALRSPVVVVDQALSTIRNHQSRHHERDVRGFEYWNEAAYRKLLTMARGPTQRRLVTDQYAAAVVRLADRQRRSGDYRCSLDTLWRALRYGPPPWAWSRSLGRTMGLLLAPPALRRWWRRRAHGQAPGPSGCDRSIEVDSAHGIRPKVPSTRTATTSRPTR